MIYWEEIKPKKRPKELHNSLIDLNGYLRPQDPPIEGVPRTTLAGLEATSPKLHRDIVIELRRVRDQDLMSPNQNSFQSLKHPGLLSVKDPQALDAQRDPRQL